MGAFLQLTALVASAGRGRGATSELTLQAMTGGLFLLEIARLWTGAAGLSTAHVADGGLRVGVPPRCAPSSVSAVSALTARVAGRCLPVRHHGSVDVFLEVLEGADEGDVLIVDNGGRLDESCVGAGVVRAAKAAGLSGIGIWGLHRDSRDLRRLGLPVFSLGALPAGPQRLDARGRGTFTSARFGDHAIRRDDVVFGDEDGLVFLPADRANEVLMQALQLREVEV